MTLWGTVAWSFGPLTWICYVREIQICIFKPLTFGGFLLDYFQWLKFTLVQSESELLLLCHFSPVRLCVTPQTAAHQAPLSLGFSRQEHRSGESELYIAYYFRCWHFTFEIKLIYLVLPSCRHIKLQVICSPLSSLGLVVEAI